MNETEKLWKEINQHFLQMKSKIEDILENNQDTLIDLTTFHKLHKVVQHQSQSAVDPYAFSKIWKIKAKEKDAFIQELAGKMRANSQDKYDLGKAPFKFPLFGMNKEEFVNAVRREIGRQENRHQERSWERQYKDLFEMKKRARPTLLEDYRKQARLTRLIFPILVNSAPEYNPDWKIKDDFPTLFRVEDLIIVSSHDHRAISWKGEPDPQFWAAITPFNYKNKTRPDWIEWRVRFDHENFPTWESDRTEELQFGISQRFTEGKRFSAKALHTWIAEVQENRQKAISGHRSFMEILKADQGIEDGSISELLEGITRSWVLGYTVPDKSFNSPVLSELGKNVDLHTVTEDPEFWAVVHEIHGDSLGDLLRSALSGFRSTI